MQRQALWQRPNSLYFLLQHAEQWGPWDVWYEWVVQLLCEEPPQAGQNPSWHILPAISFPRQKWRLLALCFSCSRCRFSTKDQDRQSRSASTLRIPSSPDFPARRLTDFLTVVTQLCSRLISICWAYPWFLRDYVKISYFLSLRNELSLSQSSQFHLRKQQNIQFRHLTTSRSIVQYLPVRCRSR